MKCFQAEKMNSQPVPTTEGLHVALYMSLNIPLGDGLAGLKMEHQKLMIDPYAEDIYHYHNRTYELFTVEDGEPTAVVNDQESQMVRGDSILIEPGDRHKLCNRTGKRATVIETRLNVHEGDRYEL